MGNTFKFTIVIIAGAVVLAPTVLALVSMSTTDLLITVVVFIVGVTIIVFASYLGEWSGRRAEHRDARRILNERRRAQHQRQRQRQKEPEPEAPPPRKRTWRTTLGFKEDEKPSMLKVRSAYRRLAKSAHPDTGGTTTQMVELSAALHDARRVLQDGAAKESEKGDTR